MAQAQVCDMTPEDEYFVSTCSHTNESDEIDACGRSRAAWLREMHGQGLRTKVALLDGAPVGFAYVVPIETSPWGPIGQDLMVLPCLWVLPAAQGKGAGRALMDAAEEEARRQRHKGIATTAFYGDFWFMPAGFFEKLGYGRARVSGKKAIFWKTFDPSAEAPSFLEPRYTFTPAQGKVVVDLFYNTFCQTSWIEAQRVRDAAADFGDTVVLNEYCADDHQVLLEHQISRAIFINGQEIGWGYEAPREGVAEAITRALR